LLEPADLDAQAVRHRHAVVPPAVVGRGHRRGAGHGEVGAIREEPRVLLRQVRWYHRQLERLR